MKKILFLAALIAGAFGFVNADDAPPVKIGLNYSAQYHYDTLGDLAGKNRGEADQYIRNEVGANFGFDIFRNDAVKITGSPFVKDRFDIKFGTTSLLSGINVVTGDVTDDGNDTVNVITGVTGVSKSVVTVIPRNRAYIGYTWGIEFPNVLKLGIMHELRIENDLSKPTLTDLRFTPAELSISGGGNNWFGFSFSVKQLAGIHFTLSEDARLDDYRTVFNSVELEGTYRIAFEFLHFIPDNSNIKGSFYVNNYLNMFLYSNEVSSQSYIKYNDITVGFEFDIYKIKPWIGLYIAPQDVKFAETKADDTELTSSADVYVGFETGLSFSKDWFSCGLTYRGRTKVLDERDSTIRTYNDFYEGLSGTDLTEAQYAAWQSHVETFVAFKL